MVSLESIYGFIAGFISGSIVLPIASRFYNVKSKWADTADKMRREIYEPVLDEIKNTKQKAKYCKTTSLRYGLEEELQCIKSSYTMDIIEETIKKEEDYNKLQELAEKEVEEIIKENIEIFSDLVEKLEKEDFKLRGVDNLIHFFKSSSYISTQNILCRYIEERELSYAWLEDQSLEFVGSLENHSNRNKIKKFLKEVNSDMKEMNSLKFYKEERNSFIKSCDKAINRLSRGIKRLKGWWRWRHGKKRVEEIDEYERKNQEKSEREIGVRGGF